MVGLIEWKYVRILVMLFILLSFIQITEEFMRSGFVEETGTSSDVLWGLFTYLSQIPVIGILFNFFTITIPNTPLLITLILNIINSLIWLFFAINLNNLVIVYFNLDEGLLGWLF